jgi:toxin FitB
VNVVDSSAWLEYFAEGPNAETFRAAIEATEELVVPSITILEVFKVVARQRGTSDALTIVAHMQQGRVVDLDAALALDAARLGAQFALPLADSIVLATAQQAGATLWTQDSHFADVPGVRYVPATLHPTRPGG